MDRSKREAQNQLEAIKQSILDGRLTHGQICDALAEEIKKVFIQRKLLKQRAMPSIIFKRHMPNCSRKSTLFKKAESVPSGMVLRLPSC